MGETMGECEQREAATIYQRWVRDADLELAAEALDTGTKSAAANVVGTRHLR